MVKKRWVYKLGWLLVIFVVGVQTAIAKEKSALEAAVIGAAEGLIIGVAAVMYFFIWLPIRKRIEASRDKKLVAANQLSPLMMAAADGEDAVILKLISEGANINQVGKNGITALMLAARNDKRSSVRLLIKHGADVFAKTEKGNDARDIARQYKNLEMASILCEYMDEQ